VRGPGFFSPCCNGVAFSPIMSCGQHVFCRRNAPPAAPNKNQDIGGEVRVGSGLRGRGCDDREVGRGGKLPHDHYHLERRRQHQLEGVSVRLFRPGRSDGRHSSTSPRLFLVVMCCFFSNVHVQRDRSLKSCAC